MFNIIDNFSEYIWCVPSKNKNAQTIIYGLPNTLSTSKRKYFELESDRRAEFHNFICILPKLICREKYLAKIQVFLKKK